MSEPTPSAQDSLRVTLQDVRTARYCLAGVRPWFRRHGFSWSEFLANGIDAERLRATGDALIDPVVRAAEARMASEFGENFGGRKARTNTETPYGR